MLVIMKLFWMITSIVFHTFCFQLGYPVWSFSFFFINYIGSGTLFWKYCFEIEFCRSYRERMTRENEVVPLPRPTLSMSAPEGSAQPDRYYYKIKIHSPLRFWGLGTVLTKSQNLLSAGDCGM